MSVLFSVIIPTLNEENYLPHLLSDIEHQITKEYEVIIADGGSSDATEKKAQDFAKKMPLLFLTCPKKSVSAQRNIGAKKATGEYLIFLDADIRLPKDFLTQVKLGLQRKNSGIFLPFMLPDDNSQKTKVLITFVNTLIRLSQTYGKPLAPGGNLIIRKDIFEKVGGFSEDLFISEDHDLVRRAYKMKYKAKILKKAKLHMSMRRSKVEGDMMLIYKYIVAFLMYTMTPGNTALKKKVFDYEMGGHRYLDEALKKPKSKKYATYLRQLLQLSSLVMAMRYFYH